jgi:hypothetical protein
MTAWGQHTKIDKLHAVSALLLAPEARGSLGARIYFAPRVMKLQCRYHGCGQAWELLRLATYISHRCTLATGRCSRWPGTNEPCCLCQHFSRNNARRLSSCMACWVRTTGERDAARFADEHRRKSGLTWHDLVLPLPEERPRKARKPRKAKPRKPPPPPTWRDMAELVAASGLARNGNAPSRPGCLRSGAAR